MPEAERQLRRLRFGDFEVDLEAGELRKAGVKQKFGGQPFQVLTILLKSPGEVVTREELQKSLWPDTFVDVDHNLNTAINKIREALGDSAETPRYVETLPRRGYRFIASVEGGVLSSDQLTEKVPLAKSNVTRRRRLYYGLAIVGVVAAVGSLALWKVVSRTPGVPKVVRFTKLTNDGQAKFGPMVTDGSRIYFNELLPGPRNLVAQVSVKGGEAGSLSVPLTLPVVLDLSRDNTELLIANSVTANEVGIELIAANSVMANAVGIEPTALWVQPVAGGSPRRVGTALVTDARFGPSGTSIIYGDGHDISLMSEDGAFSQKLLSVDGNTVGFRNTPFAFRFSPDARVLRFTQYDSAVDNLTIMEAKANGTGLHKMSSGCCGEWTVDGQYFIFQDRDEGRLDLWAIPEERGFSRRKQDATPTRLTAGPLDFQYPLPSKDGKEIFAIGTSRRAELVRYDPHSSQFVPFLSGISAEGLAFSQDGQWVAYISYPEGTLWRCKVDGSERTQLTFSPLRAFLPRWSPDGTQIAFSATLHQTRLNIYLVSSKGGTPQRILPSDQIQTDVNWSPDGRSLLFGSLMFQNAPIYTIDLATKRVAPLPDSSGFFSPHWSPDGRHIAAITKAHRTLMLFDLTTQKWTQAYGYEMGWEHWSHDGKYLYFLDYHDPEAGFHYRVVRLRVNDLKIENIVDIKNVGRLTNGTFAAWFGLAPDDSPLFARDISSQEIYALEMDWP